MKFDYPSVLARFFKKSPRRGARLSHEQAETLTGRKITPRVFDYEPQGSRLVVVKDEVAKKIGGIDVPDDVQDRHTRGSGFIISAGPDAGLTQLNVIGNIATTDGPEGLLGLHVIFGSAVGKALKVSVYDSDFKSDMVLINTNDIWLVDFNERPTVADEEAHEAMKQVRDSEEEEAADSISRLRAELKSHIAPTASTTSTAS